MKKCTGKIIITAAVLLIGSTASAAITSTYTDVGNLSASVLELTASSVSVQAGDTVVMIAVGNKKVSATAVTFSSLAGTFTDVSANVVLSSDPNPNTYMAHLTIINPGTYDFVATASAASSMNVGLYVLSADSGNIALLDNDAVEYSGYSTVSESFSITNSLSWTGDASYGDIIAIGAASSLKGNISAVTLTSLDENNVSKRLAGDIAVAAGTTAYDIVWDITVAAATESGSAVAAAFTETASEPLLVSIDNVVTDDSGNGLAGIGETNTVQVVIANNGGAAATNVETAVSIASNPTYFTIVTNSSVSELTAGSQVTNVYTIVPSVLAVPDTYTFDVVITADGGYGDASTFDIIVAQSAAVLENVANIVSDASGDGKSNPAETNTVSVVVLNGGQGAASNVTVGVSAVTNGAWFSIATNTSPADLAGGDTQTNEFIIVASLDTLPGDYSFDVSITADGGLSTNGSFVITVPVKAVIPTAPVEWWGMNDTVGIDLNDLANSGSLSSEWNFNTVGAVTDGNGSFVIDGDSGTTTRKLPKKGSANAETNGVLDVYASPLTSGAYSLTVNFDSWSWDSASEGDLWKLKAQDLSGEDIAGIELGYISGQGRIRLWTEVDVTNTSYRSFDLPAASLAGATAQIVFDFDADTVSYVVDGVEEFSAIGFSGSELSGLVYTTSGDGTADWATAASSISIDSMGLDVVGSVPTAIVDQSGATLANNLSNAVTVATFTAETGDVLVLGAGGSNANHVQPNAVSWTSLDGGMVDATVATNRASAALWYTTVTNGGTFNVEFTPSDNYVTVGAYQIRPQDTEAMAIDVQGRWLAAEASSTNATLSYDIVDDSDVAIVEVMACGTSAASLVATVDYANAPPKRLIASGAFEGVSSLTGEWTIDQSDTNSLTSVSLIGISIYYSTNLLVATDTPASLYNDWLGSETSNTNLLEDVDGDGVNNLVDYAIGGAANIPASSIDGAYLQFVHVQWDDTEAAARGLSYTVDANTNLTNVAGWSTNGVEFVGSAADTPATGYLTVTNKVPTTDAGKFLRLHVEFSNP